MFCTHCYNIGYCCQVSVHHYEKLLCLGSVSSKPITSAMPEMQSGKLGLCEMHCSYEYTCTQCHTSSCHTTPYNTRQQYTYDYALNIHHSVYDDTKAMLTWFVLFVYIYVFLSSRLVDCFA